MLVKLRAQVNLYEKVGIAKHDDDTNEQRNERVPELRNGAESLIGQVIVTAAT